MTDTREDIRFAESQIAQHNEEIEELYRRKMEAPKQYKIEKPMETGAIDTRTLQDNDRVRVEYSDGCIWWRRWSDCKNSNSIRLKTAKIIAVRRME